ncbi:Maf family protein [Sediminibacillus albus]|uniref:dTTP/UTP pyrophosphatase n=1 Tax=Sediminibacillus albus TaxID=407036 RepID=A0A1G9BN05_9BACI|nr:Maf family protein [Sediminibacillus albus]SDK40862.1 septum formation protein [Sediminibacillus albus]
MAQLILASGSPRRKALLKQAGLAFTVNVPQVDEKSIKEKDPERLVKKLAILKGESLPLKQGQVLLSADTVVSHQREILTKPEDEKEAFAMLSRLNGDTHEVFTGVSIRSYEEEIVFAVCTRVRFWYMSTAELVAYIQTGEPFDKAGGYGIQGRGALLVKEISGDYFNVVGLPLSTVVRKLKPFGIFPYHLGS